VFLEIGYNFVNGSPQIGKRKRCARCGVRQLAECERIKASQREKFKAAAGQEVVRTDFFGEE
jgi:hypothetical protein